MTTTEARPLYEIAADVKANWANVWFGAVPYLEAMEMMGPVTDNFGSEDAKSVVIYFLSNAKYWRGPDAARIKAELKGLVKL